MPADLAIDAQPEGVRFRFSLPSGAYATSLLREFVGRGCDAPEAHEPHEEDVEEDDEDELAPVLVVAEGVVEPPRSEAVSGRDTSPPVYRAPVRLRLPKEWEL